VTAAAPATYDGLPVLWQPHPGPQTQFLTITAHEALYGGAAGGGKSDALLFGALRQVEHPQYRALILRRTFPELRELMDRALPIFTGIGAMWNASEKRFRFPSGAVVEFGYCESYAEVLQYQGKAYQYIGWDELGQIPEERIWTYLISRNRPTAPGQRLMMRASANPGGAGHHWLKKRFVSVCPPDGSLVAVETPLPDGATILTTRAFVPAKLKDNPTLMENDPTYGQRLALLPELEYKWLAEGDWEAGAGLALQMTKHHWTKPFEPPAHWPLFAALDWGYNHPFSWGLYAVSGDGVVYCLDTATGRHLQPPAMADRFAGILKGRPLKYTVAGHDCWADIKARSEHVPTLAEQFAALGFPMIKANISRVAGVQNFRRYLSLPPVGEDGAQPPPRFLLCDTPNNRKVYECLESRVSDPDEPEDVLKVDADANGDGGDDHYDQVRYALASRPIAARLPKAEAVKVEDRAAKWTFTPEGKVVTTVPKPQDTLDRALSHGLPRGPRVPSRNWRKG
jgi:hypothetical protein